MKPVQPTPVRKSLDPIFEVFLQYHPETSPVSMEGEFGEYIGSGDGSVDGSRLRGEVHWTLFEEVNDAYCLSNLFGVINTTDGAIINFTSLGYFVVPDSDRPYHWITTAAVRFETDDERYAWLNLIPGVWEGELDMQTYRHHYRVYQG